MDPQRIIVYHSQTDMFWDQAVANGDAVVYVFWILVCCLAVVALVVGYYKVKEYLARRGPRWRQSRRYGEYGYWR